ncbi:hypothetical protein HHI36_022258 [Cryptolaemus montrouzieri]|uniref:Endonuclease/exonuclease/phosphatase domain-containing protein n=1 Tax=Cryptolaemus montrouzieri TaxID=559131 RepID=A0ABD2MZ69_9CUCU
MILEDFETFCDDVVARNSKFIVVGDFNLDFPGEKFYLLKIKDQFSSKGIKLLFYGPNRLTIDTSTLEDYVLSNEDRASVLVHGTTKLSDHPVLSVN